MVSCSRCRAGTIVFEGSDTSAGALGKRHAGVWRRIRQGKTKINVVTGSNSNAELNVGSRVDSAGKRWMNTV
ncbi:MAG: hypothetical protein LBB25_00800 [Holosporaceae bacterium]|nr:hypothetical protein [Holosporaceae bacterium]